VNSLGQQVSASDISIGRVTYGAELAYRIQIRHGLVAEPHIAIHGITNFDTDDLVINGSLVETSASRAKVEGGVIFWTQSGWSVRAAASYDGIGQSEFESVSGRLWFNIKLN
jgi:hypothetical protein